MKSGGRTRRRIFSFSFLFHVYILVHTEHSHCTFEIELTEITFTDERAHSFEGVSKSLNISSSKSNGNMAYISHKHFNLLPFNYRYFQFFFPLTHSLSFVKTEVA